MAGVPTRPLVSVDEYLNTSYEQDFEYVDGRLVSKGMPTPFHQLLCAILLRWFYQYEKEFRVKALADVRTQIVERARYRLPDVMVFSLPVQLGKVLTCVPDVVIEILSPDDRKRDILERFADYQGLGVPHLIHMHPEKMIAWRYEGKSLIRQDFHTLPLPGRGVLPFDSAAIFDSCAVRSPSVRAVKGSGNGLGAASIQ
jgi:Uma2 family endonuclease